MPFTGNEDQKISLSDAAALTSRYRQTAGTGAVLGTYFSKTTLQNILNQANCVGIRFYNGLTTANAPKLILVGVVSNMNDIDGGELAEHSLDCPPFCSAPNSLNS